MLVTGMVGYAATGIIGCPSAATATKGKAVMDTLVMSFADHLDILGG
ncbi:MAG TPA: hypothetical protein VGM60_25235 [Pseudonocardia sp.]